MENKTVSFTYKQLTAVVSLLVAIAGGELAIGTTLFESETNRQFVGFFIDESGNLKFTHLDGQTYVPILDEKNERYYIVLSCGKFVWCY